jgi:hypothetical protein
MKFFPKPFPYSLPERFEINHKRLCQVKANVPLWYHPFSNRHKTLRSGSSVLPKPGFLLKGVALPFMMDSM